MLKVVTAEEMQKIDRTTIEKYGIAGAILMERAGLAVVQKINELFFEKSEIGGTKVIVLCGSGNNGGDGLVVARVLHNLGRDVKVYLTANPKDLKGDAAVNYLAAVKFGVKIYSFKKLSTLNSSLITHNCLIVDALLGTGLNKDLRYPLTNVINKINELRFPVVAIDIPSGISSDTGQVMGCAVKAQVTVTFGLPKRGHYLYPGAEYTGKLYVEDIGFPRELTVSKKIRVNLIQKDDIVSLLPKRPRYSHKGTYGHVLLIAGSKGKTGAALMAAKACLRTGAGLVTIGIPESLVSSFQSRVTEEMILPLPDKGNGTLSFKSSDTILTFLKKRANVLAIGPGLSEDNEIADLVYSLIKGSEKPVVIDADGLNAINGRTSILKRSRSPIILTPHVGEMARLLQVSSVKCQVSRVKELQRNIEQDRIQTALSFSRKTGTYLVLKGVPTVIASPDGRAFLNSTGNPGMAKAGTGDVLTGMISSLLAQRLTPQNASITGVYLHGLTGDIAAQEKGERSFVASDMIRAIPRVFHFIKKSNNLEP